MPVRLTPGWVRPKYTIAINNTQKNSDGTPYYPYETHKVIRCDVGRVAVGTTLYVDNRGGCEHYLARLNSVDYEKIARKLYSHTAREPNMIQIDGEDVDKVELLRVLSEVMVRLD